ncbi:MAG: ATP-dependent DNA helicase, partial [Candidatus Firestonebacteria bacterium]|nr:ATP-dependent DNA helicase [Candidatus Firestonebacteria bacterium]
MDLDSFFSPGGELSRLEQAQMAASVADALDEGTHVLVEAGTGVGKSLAYLVPGIAWALAQETRLMVSTHTKALQAQLMNHELPLLSENLVFGRRFAFEICLGVENYVCLQRLLREGSAEMLPGMEDAYADDLKSVMTWCAENVTGIRQDAPFAVSESLWRQVRAERELCLGTKCQHRKDCFWQQARDRQRQADVLVTNHSLFFSNLAAAGRLLPEFQAAILDEAHRVEDVAANFLGDELSQSDLLQLLAEIGRRGRGGFLNRLQKLSPTRAEEIAALVYGFEARQETWWQQVSALFPPGADTLRFKQPHPGLERPETEALLELSRVLEDLQSVWETEEDAKAAAYLAARLEDAARRWRLWHEHTAPGFVYWAETYPSGRSRRVRLLATPLDLSTRLREMAFEAIPSVVLTSATLAVNGSFDYLKARLGIVAARELILKSPFPYEENAAVYVPRNIPDPRDAEAYEARILQETGQLIRAFGGGTFVLFTSHRFLRRAAEALRANLPEQLFLVQGEDTTPRLLHRFREHQNAVLLGVETFWQGVNVPGDALRCVVITRLPFDVPTH